MSCSNTGKFTKKKIIVFSLIGIAIAVTTYFVYTGTNSSAALALPVLLGFAACPLMCVVMGGVIWLAARFGNKKSQKVNNKKSHSDRHSCCAEHSEQRQRNFDN